MDILSDIFNIKAEKIFIHTKDRIVVKARRLYCFWLVNDLGISMTKIANTLNVSVPSVSKSVKIGEQLCTENGWQLKKFIKS